MVVKSTMLRAWGFRIIAYCFGNVDIARAVLLQHMITVKEAERLLIDDSASGIDILFLLILEVSI